MFGPYGFSFGRPSPKPFSRPFTNLSFEDDEEPYSFGEEAQDPSQGNTQPNLMNAYRELLKGQNGPSMESYRKFLSSGAPRREDFKPGKMNRISAILSGVASSFSGDPGNAVSRVTEMMDVPYKKALGSYGQEGSRLKELAELESLDQKGRISAFKTVSDAENQRVDNERERLVAESLIKQRTLNMDKTRQEIENAGLRWVVKEDTGEGGFVRANGSFQPVGKFNLSTKERVKQVKDRDVFRETLRKSTGLALEGARSANRIKEEETKQTNRLEMVDEKGKQQLKRDAARAGLKTPNESINQTLLRNRTKVQSLVDGEPDKYDNVWIMNPQTGYMELNREKKDTPEYKALYAALYANVDKQASKYKIER